MEGKAPGLDQVWGDPHRDVCQGQSRTHLTGKKKRHFRFTLSISGPQFCGLRLCLRKNESGTPARKWALRPHLPWVPSLWCRPPQVYLRQYTVKPLYIKSSSCKETGGLDQACPSTQAFCWKYISEKSHLPIDSLYKVFFFFQLATCLPILSITIKTKKQANKPLKIKATKVKGHDAVQERRMGT